MTAIDFDSRTTQTVAIPGERPGVLTAGSTRFAAAVRREAKARGLYVHVTIANGATAHVHLLDQDHPLARAAQLQRERNAIRRSRKQRLGI